MAASGETMHPQERTDRDLVERARCGDAEAQQDLWTTHRRWVAAVVLAHRPRAVDVDDLMQDVAVKFVTRLDTLRDPGSFRPWLRRIIINVCRGSARRLRPTLALAPGEMQADGPAAANGTVSAAAASEAALGEATVDRRDAAGTLLARVMTLPSDYREPLLLRCVRELSYQQIAEVLDLPVTTIETRLARARRMLREEVGEPACRDGLL